MSEKRTHMDYLQKAMMYDSLAQYYKYSYPNLHIHYYYKHLKYINKAINTMRNPAQPNMGEAKVRVLHASPDAPNVDIYVNGNRVIKDLAFSKESQELSLKPGKYNIEIYPAGKMVDSVLSKKISVEGEKSYTLAAIDRVKKLRLLVFQNALDVPVNEAKVRFIHLSPDTKAIDIAVKNRDVIFSNVGYKQATDYLGLMPMTVDLEVREPGSKQVLFPLPNLQFKPNEIYTIIFVGLSNGNPNLQYIILKD